MTAAPPQRKQTAAIPPSFPSRQEAVAATLRADILRGRVAAGARLDIDEIAARHGVSRTPVRDALKQLEAEGLVRVLPYRGVEVTRLSAEDVRELFAIRIALERQAVAEAARQVSEVELGRLRRILERMDRARGRDAGWMALNIAFHDAVHMASRWPRLVELIRVQRTNVERHVRASAADLGIAAQQADHWALLGALAERDAAGAEAVMVRHLSRTAELLARPACTKA
jgi:DNA-binding GntR family transcriptional regulator